MKIIAHTMEYRGGSIVSPLRLRNYSAFDYEEYKRIYEECFRDMRTALQRFPVDCCDSKEELEHKKDKIYDNEIDDLIVEKSYQRAGYGEALLQFAISYMQSDNIFPIVLHVADWNQGAIKMYMKNGFAIVKTEET